MYTAALVFIPAALFAAAIAMPSRAKPAQTASPSSHSGLTITATPWLRADQYKEKFGRKSPLAAGVVAIEVTFRNDSADSIKLNLETIRMNLQLSDDDRQELRPLTPGQVADAVTKPGAKDPTRRRLPIPVPLGGVGSGQDKKWEEVKTAAQNAAVPASVIAPHSTVKGLMYFDMQGQFDLLDSAKLYVPDVHALETNQDLLYFEIALSSSSASH
jgi:hypothetical protein